MKNIQDIRIILANKGMKVTPQRIAVYQALSNMKSHPTAEEIFVKVRDYIPSISLASVYNTLNSFVRCELITTVNTDDDTVRYDAIREPHHHLLCNESGKIIDFEDNELSEYLRRYFKDKKLKNFVIEDIKLQLIGKII